MPPPQPRLQFWRPALLLSWPAVRPRQRHVPHPTATTGSVRRVFCCPTMKCFPLVPRSLPCCRDAMTLRRQEFGSGSGSSAFAARRSRAPGAVRAGVVAPAESPAARAWRALVQGAPRPSRQMKRGRSTGCHSPRPSALPSPLAVSLAPRRAPGVVRKGGVAPAEAAAESPAARAWRALVQGAPRPSRQMKRGRSTGCHSYRPSALPSPLAAGTPPTRQRPTRRAKRFVGRAAAPRAPSPRSRLGKQPCDMRRECLPGPLGPLRARCPLSALPGRRSIQQVGPSSLHLIHGAW